MAFVNFFYCNDPKFLEEVIRFNRNDSKWWKKVFHWKLFSGGITLFYAEPCHFNKLDIHKACENIS